MKLNIWLILDGKRGHEKQIEDLAFCINKKITSNIKKIKKISLLKIIFNFLGIGVDPCRNFSRPDLIIAAGHKTHLDALQKKLKYGGKVILIMKPSIPSFLFDLTIIPFHDKIFWGKNILKIFGSVNKIENKRKQLKNKAIIMVGGPSKNFLWNSSEIILSIKKIIEKNPKLIFTLATSRRTPENFLTDIQINYNFCNKLEIVDHRFFSPQWLETEISKYEYSWVTQDSISMMNELISAGSKVTCISMQSVNTKFDKMYQDLYEKKIINFNNKKTQKIIFKESQISTAVFCANFITKKFFKNYCER